MPRLSGGSPVLMRRVRSRIALLLAVAATLVTWGADSGNPTARPEIQGASAWVAAGQAGAAVHAVDEWAAGQQGIFGVAALDRSTGTLAVGGAADRPVYSASLVKLLVAVDILQRRHSGQPIGEDTLALVHNALAASDDNAMNALWASYDGPGAVIRVAQQAHLSATVPPLDASQWGQTLLSAHDVVWLFDYVLTALPAEDRDFLLSSLRGAPDVAADGFDQSFGLKSGGRAVKSAWMCCYADEIELHSAGVVGDGRYIVALLSEQPDFDGYEGARAAITEAARIATDELEPQTGKIGG